MIHWLNMYLRLSRHPNAVDQVGGWLNGLKSVFSRGKPKNIGAYVDVSKIGNSIPRGVYLYGDVGCGKTMLMDLFYTTIPNHLTKKRIHFHQFMQYVHKRSHEIVREQNLKELGDAKGKRDRYGSIFGRRDCK